VQKTKEFAYNYYNVMSMYIHGLNLQILIHAVFISRF